MKKIILAIALIAVSSSALARYENCSPKFQENLVLDYDESILMIRDDLNELAKNYIEREMVYEIEEQEIFKANYVLYCTEMGKTNKIIYYLNNNLESYEANQYEQDKDI